MLTPAARGEVCFDPAAAAQMERIVHDLGRMYQERNEALEQLSRAHHDALLRLSMAAEYKDDDTGVHVMRIACLAEALALRLGVDARFAHMLRQAAPMHDIGKIGIPDSVLKKPGPLTPEERAVMNRHPLIGAEILGRSRVPLFQLAAEVALSHHERHDGGGYPHGRAGEDIPLAGRIVAVVDCFDALTMDRVYRPAFSDDQALHMLDEQRGRAFDPRVLDAFLDHAGEMVDQRDRVNRNRPGHESLVG